MTGIQEFQDLGDLGPTIRTTAGVKESGVEVLVPDDDTTFSEASEAFRDVLDEHYGENFDRLCDEGEKVVVERLVVQSDEPPYIEYTIVEEIEDE